MPDRIFEGLNEEQAQAVACVTGPVVILAGAGSGKTTTVTRRIAHQVTGGTHRPERILAVTFTDKAAREMASRLAALGFPGVRVKTFHAEALAQYRTLSGRSDEILPSKTPLLVPLTQRLPMPHRFVSVRDGPNVRQAYDAVWLDWEQHQWRFIAFWSMPVQYRNEHFFDDFSSEHFQYGGVRAERQGVGPGDLSAYYSRFILDKTRFLDARGDERRNNFDLRYAGARSGFDWDVEAMGQVGDIGGKSIRAWGVGSRSGYTIADLPWTPRLGLQIDAASGDHKAGDNTLGTFNPLFPNGYYFTLAGYTGYVNLIHVKPSLTVKPIKNLTLMVAAAMQWRETTADAVYVQPNIPVPGTAGKAGRWTGVYTQVRADWAITPSLQAAVEAVRFQIGDAIRRAGGHDSTYFNVELKYGW